MPTFKSILPFWRDLGSGTGGKAHSIRQRPLPKAILTGAKHELMFELVMRNDDEQRMPPREMHRRPHRPEMASG